MPPLSHGASEVEVRAILHPVEDLDVSAYAIPTDAPESDGTFEWKQTTLVLVRIRSGRTTGIGFTYADAASARLIDDTLKKTVMGKESGAIPHLWNLMSRSVRNLGRLGVASMAISAVDIALWDLKARLLDLPLVSLLGAARHAVSFYGSGGFTSYSDQEMRGQLTAWENQGFAQFKIKVGRNKERDVDRVSVARSAIGPASELFVDANGAYHRSEALVFAQRFAERGVSWFEEPVTSDDLDGLKMIRDRAPAGMEIAAGEYGYTSDYFLRMLKAGAVDVLQADATRCGGVTGFLAAAALADAFHIPLSSHCAPAIHLHPAASVRRFRHLEYFHDHARIEKLFFEGTVAPRNGVYKPDLSLPGLGLEFRDSDAEKYRVYGEKK